MSEWQPIETAPTNHYRFNERVLLARFYPRLDENDDETSELVLAWAQVAGLTHQGWRVNTAGCMDLHGHASFRLSDATHWMPLPSPPAGAPR